MTSPSLYNDITLEVEDDLHVSDHFPVIITLINNKTNINRTKYSYNKTNWDHLKKICDEEMDESDEINDESMDKWVNNIMKTIKQTTPTLPSKN